jgi:hypothetical protein
MDQGQIISRLKQSLKELDIPGLHLKPVKISAKQPLEIYVAYAGKELRLLCEVKSDARSITIERAISQLEELMKQKYRENAKPG